MCVTIDDLTDMSVGNETQLRKWVNEEIVKVCVAHDVPAIGFVNENKVYKNGQIDSASVNMLKFWLDHGLELGNHTYSHLDYNKVAPEEFFKEIERGQIVTNQLLGPDQQVKYFRHPFLHRGDTKEKVEALENYLEQHDLIEAPVTIDNSEWIYAAAYKKAFDQEDKLMKDSIGQSYISYMMKKVKYYEKASNTLFGRPIAHTLLIHDNLLNAEHLNSLLAALEKEGYDFISLEEALLDPAYSSDDQVAASWGISWIQRWAITQKRPKEFYVGEPLCPQFIKDYSGIKE